MRERFFKELNKYDSEYNKLDKLVINFPITKDIFKHNDLNHEEIFLLAIISLRSNILEFEGVIDVRSFSIMQLYHECCIHDKNIKRHLKSIEDNLISLIDKGVINLIEKNGDYYHVQQVVSDGYFHIASNEIENILHSDNAIGKRMKIVSDYVSVCYRVYNGSSHKDTKRFISYEGLDSIGERRGSNRRSASEMIGLACDMKSLAAYKVKYRQNGFQKLIMSRYSHRALLRNYVLRGVEQGRWFLMDELGLIDTPKLEALTEAYSDELEGSEFNIDRCVEMYANIINIDPSKVERYVISRLNKFADAFGYKVVHSAIVGRTDKFRGIVLSRNFESVEHKNNTVLQAIEKELNEFDERVNKGNNDNAVYESEIDDDEDNFNMSDFD